MDPDERCSIGGFPGINAGILRERETMVFDWFAQRGISIAFVLAGGYAGDSLRKDDLVALHRMTIAEGQRGRSIR